MTTMAALACGILVAGAALLIWAAFQPAPTNHQPSISMATRWARISRRPSGRAGKLRDIALAVSVVLGAAVTVLTGWVPALLLCPAAVFIGPALFGVAPPTDIPLLEALDRWVRTLMITLPLGRDVAQSVRITRPSAPPLLAPHVDRLVARIDAGHDAARALGKMADELDNVEADAVIASLMLATRHSQGLTANLEQIAANLQDRLAAAREIEAERAKPRGTARQITIFTLVLIAAGTLLGNYFAPFATPIGQVLAAVLAAAYVTSSLWMQRMTVPRRRARIIVTHQDRP